MFKTGSYIVCGSHGVCKVESAGPLEMAAATQKKDYYTLSQVYVKGGVVYTPTESDKVVMRPVISREEAEELIDHIEEVDTLDIVNEKRREDVYKSALKTCDYTHWVQMIKTLYSRKQTRITQGKKVTASDERYLRIAEENLYGELAIALNMDKDEVEQYIIDRMAALKDA